MMSLGQKFLNGIIDKLELKANKFIERFPLKPVKFALAEFDQDAGLMGGVSVALAIAD